MSLSPTKYRAGPYTMFQLRNSLHKLNVTQNEGPRSKNKNNPRTHGCGYPRTEAGENQRTEDIAVHNQICEIERSRINAEIEKLLIAGMQ